MESVRGLGSPTFSSLGLDTLVNILEYLSPVHIIYIGQTCRSLHETTKKRIVWIYAVQRIMQQHAISITTCPLQRMTTDALRHVALSPARIATLIKKNNGAKMLASSIRFLPWYLKEEEKIGHGIQDAGAVQYFVLASGGRFLATLSTDATWHGSSLLSIWDLGITGNGAPVSLARYLEASANMQLRLFFEDPLEASTFFVVSVIRMSTSITVIVHNAVFGESSATLEPFSKLVIPTRVPTPNCLVHLLPRSRRITISAYYDNRYNIHIWDIEKGTGALLITSSCPLKDDAELFAYDDCILFSVGDQLMVYNVLDLVPYFPAQGQPGQTPVTVFEPSSRSADSFYVSFNSVVPHCSTSCLPHHHLFLVNLRQLSVLAVEDHHEPKSPTSPNKKLTFKGRVEVTDIIYAATKGAVMGQFDGRLYLLSFYKDHNCLLSLLNANPRTTQEEDKTLDLDFVSTTLEHPHSIDMALVEYSAFLGRYCLLTPDGDVAIMDY